MYLGDKMIKVSEIAKITGYSISTVSRVLNNKGNFSNETVKKIREVVNTFNYRPNTVAEKIINNNYTIAIFFPQRDAFIENNPTYSGDLPNLREELERCGNMVVLAANSEKLDRNSMSYRIIEEKKIDGAIVNGPLVDDEIVKLLISYGIPYIVTNGVDYSQDWNYVDYNHFSASSEAIDYLYSLGHKNIGIIGGPKNHLVTVNRMDGCIQSLNKLGIDYSDNRIVYGPFNYDHGYSSAKELLENHKDITAFFAFNDIIACGALKAIHEFGHKVPDDISVIGFDDIEMSRYSNPALTTIRRYNNTFYKLIAELLNDLISYNIEKVNISFKTEFIVRESCKKIK